MHLHKIIPVDALAEKTDYIFHRLNQKGIQCAALSISNHKGFSLRFRKSVVDSLEYDDAQAFALKIFSNQKSVSVSTTDLSLTSLNMIIEKALSLIKYVQVDEHSGLPAVDELAFEALDLSLYHPYPVVIANALDQMMACEQLIHTYSTPSIRITSEAIQLSSYDGFLWLANTVNKFRGYYPYSRHSFSCQVIAKVEDQMQADYDYTVARSSNNLESMNAVAKRAVARTIKRLDARQAKPGFFPIIFEARIAVSLWRHLFAAIDGMAIYRQMSFLCGAKGKIIFPEFVSITQKPHIIAGLNSAPFDSEGVMTQNVQYVEKGRLINYLLSTYTARCLNLKTTGNAGGVYNIEISTGKDSLETLCQQMQTGYLITELLGQGVNIVTGDYSRGAFGYWVEKGEIQYPVHELTIANNLKQMFQQILAIGNDRTRYSNISTGSVLIDNMVVSAS